MRDEHAPDEATSNRISQLERDLSDSREQMRATGEVLSALGRSVADPDALLGTIVGSARKLCRADVSQIHLLNGDRFELASESGSPELYRDWIAAHPMLLDRGTLLGRVALDRMTQQIPDVLADPLYGRPDSQQMGGFRTIIDYHDEDAPALAKMRMVLK